MDTKPTRPPRGRPVKPTDERTLQITVRLRPALVEKVKANGGAAWVRQLIERAKPAVKPDSA